MRGKVLLAVVIFSSSFVWGRTNAAAPQQKRGLPTAKSSQSVRAELTGMELRRRGELTKCRSDCELTLGGVLVKADEVDYHSETGEAEARGNVRILDHRAIKGLPDTVSRSTNPSRREKD